ncbi:MAG TPA: hypothetical protein VGQ26_02150 [Streptosporangiaceae bacterium]|jgi:hypothetical protein|nr:hypothetical protein [Streptosporangiaceae bacterium]
MADPPRSPETEDEARRGADGGAASGTPRWLLILVAIVAVALLGLMVVLHLTGTLGPGRH